MAIKKKKGAIEVQFNWIFILIIGAIILLFFFSIVKTQRTISDTKISATVRRDIRAILTGASVSTGTASLVEIPKTQIDYDCEGYSIQKTSYVKPQVSFSPDSINDIQLMLWALDWNIGYRVTNFLYITPHNIRYVLVYKEGIGEEEKRQLKFVDIINETLPSKYIYEEKDRKTLMNKEKAKLVSNQLKDMEDNDFIDKNNYKVKFVFFNQDPTSTYISALNEMQDKDVTAINVIPDNTKCVNNLDCFGTIEYYKKNNNLFVSTGETSYYIKLPSLIGAIFSEFENYNCNMENAFKRLKLVTDVYYDKTTALESYYTSPPNFECLSIMNTIKNTLNNIKSEVDKEFDNADLEIIYDNIQDLEGYNEQAIKLSCAEIY